MKLFPPSTSKSTDCSKKTKEKNEIVCAHTHTVCDNIVFDGNFKDLKRHRNRKNLFEGIVAGRNPSIEIFNSFQEMLSGCLENKQFGVLFGTSDPDYTHIIMSEVKGS